MPSLVWIEGGEHGLFVTGAGASLWSTVVTAAGGSWTQETSAIARTGACIKAVAPANLAHNVRSPTVAGDFPNALAVLRFYVRFETLPTGGLVTLAFINPNGGAFHELVFTPSTGFFGHRIGSGAAAEDNVTVQTGVWYRIDMKFDVSANPWTADMEIDGRALTQRTNAVVAATILNCGFGTVATTQPAHTWYIDDVAASATAADYPLGAGHVTLLVPGSDGTHSFTANDFSTGDAGTQRAPSYTDFHLMVDDAMPWATARSTTDDIAQRVIRTTGYVEIAPGATPDTETANGVQARLAYSSTATTADTGACIVRNSAGASVVLWGDLPAGQGGGGGALADYSESSNFFKRKIVTAPGAGWTPTEVNAIRWRLGGSGDITPVPTWQALLLEVDCPDAAGGAVDLAAAIAGTGALSPAVTKQAPLNLAIAGVGTLSPRLVKTRPLNVAIAGLGSLAPNLIKAGAKDLAVAISGAGALAAKLGKAVVLNTSIAGTGALAANLRETISLRLAASGTGQLVASFREQIALRMAATGQGVLSATLSVAGGGVSTLIERTRRGVGQ
jgi:hypothetical protein